MDRWFVFYYNYLEIVTYQNFLYVNEHYEKYKFGPESIFNGDETNDPTVVEPAKIIAQKGSHQVLFLFLSITGLN